MVKLIILMTDFGMRDGYPGIMKGVILKIAPDAQINDLTHAITPQNVMEGAQALLRAVPYFPPGTVFCAVVDPGVGTARRPLAVRAGDALLVGPDNGLFTPVIERARSLGQPVEAVHLDRPQYWLPEVSSVFHGRDIFAPVAAHLANGVELIALGTPVTDLVELHLPEPQPIEGGWCGQVMHVDGFGNLSTNLTRAHLPKGHVLIRLPGAEVHGLVRAFGDGAPGELVALIDSSNRVSVCVVNGSAADRLKVQVGTPVEVIGE